MSVGHRRAAAQPLTSSGLAVRCACQGRLIISVRPRRWSARQRRVFFSHFAQTFSQVPERGPGLTATVAVLGRLGWARRERLSNSVHPEQSKGG